MFDCLILLLIHNLLSFVHVDTSFLHYISLYAICGQKDVGRNAAQSDVNLLSLSSLGPKFRPGLSPEHRNKPLESLEL